MTRSSTASADASGTIRGSVRSSMRLASLVGLVALLGSAAHARAETAEPALFAEQVGTRGFLYEVRPARGQRRLFLYGTLHVGKAGQSPFTHAVRQSLSQCSRLALEADVSNLGGAVGQLMSLGMYPA